VIEHLQEANPRRIGVIAGSGQFPIIFSKAARAKGYVVYAVAYLKEADPLLKEYAEAILWVHLGQINRIIKFFKQNQVNEAVFLGAIKKTRMFSDVRPDIKAITLLAGMRHTLDDGILSAFAGILEKDNIKILPSTLLLPDLLADEGVWTKRKPTRSEKADIDLGWGLAKEIGRFDIGQCVIVGGGTVLAVEAVDGTDSTIKRGGQLGNGTAVVVKVCKPNQDTRFDIPAIGLKTITTMYESGAKVLVVEAGKTVVFDKEDMIECANKHKIAIVAKK
jgi:DUF1009 family protein